MAGYSRQSVADIVASAVIKAGPINTEYNALRDAFAFSTGHKHDGSSTEGAYIPLIADLDAKNKVVVDTTNNRISFYSEVSGSAVEQLRIQDGAIVPVTDDDVDLGAVGAEFKDLHIDGVGYIDTIAVHENATIAGTLDVTGLSTLASVDINSGSIDNTNIGSTVPTTVVGTTISATTQFSGDITGDVLGDVTGDITGNVTGNVTGNITSTGTSTFSAIDVNGGAIDDTPIGANSASSGAFTTISTSGAATLASADINGGTVDNSTIGATTPSTIVGTNITANTGFVGDLTGNVTGNVTGNTTGDVTGDLTGNVTGDVTSTGTSSFQDVTVNGTLNMNAGTTATITNLSAPTNDNDAARKVDVDNAVANLVDSAPGTLDTLNELAAALGDDADFSTTITNSIATKLPLAGGTMTGAIAMSTNKITGVGDPTAAQDVSSKAYTDTQDATKLSLSGGTMTGAIDMGSAKVTTTYTPTDAADLTTKTYVDSIIGSATSSADSAAAAATSESNAASSETAAAASETAAATSASNASTSESNAAGSATAAATSASNASTSEANASTSEVNAASSATAASNSETAAALSESNASASESAASTSETNAAGSESAAAGSATAAAISESNAATSETNAAASFDSFDDRYLGSKTSAPTLDNDGDALLTGAIYFNSATSNLYIWTGSAWSLAVFDTNDALFGANNLSDVASAITSRTNLGLGSVATTDIGDYATAAQGSLADSAVQDNDSPTFNNITVTGTVDGRDVATDGVKLDGIEASADVTDTTNVSSAGALMRTGGTMTGNLILNADPSTSLGAATKEYVDTIAAAGLHYHDPVRVEKEGNLNVTYDNGTAGVGATLTNAGTQAALVIDGVTMVLNDRVLVYEQADATQNGVYTVTDIGSASTNWVLTRSTDTDSYAPSDPNSFGKGDAFFVLEGNAGAGELYVMNTEGSITFGTTNITFTQVASTAVYTAGNGLTLTGTQFTIDGTVLVDGDIGSTVQAHSSALDGTTASYTTAEKTKLSGIEAGATADQTAAQILTAVKTVDGSGSGLDADLLDGFNTSQQENGNTVAVRNSSGYLLASFFNGSGTFSTTGNTSGMALFTGTNGTDTYGRSYTAAAARSLLNVADGATNVTNNNQLTNGAGYTTYSANQSLNTNSSPTFANVYNTGWFYNSQSNEGMYNQATSQHWYSDDDDWWNVAGGGAANGIRFRDDHNSTVRGSVYATNSNEIGFLDSDSHWAIKHVRDSRTEFFINNSEKMQLDSSNLTVHHGSVVLGGTGRIQGVDTVSSGTDAANKNYVDTAIASSGASMATMYTYV
jgi:hypothetical protein